MITGFYTSAGGAVTQGIRHGVLANNLANVNTAGFRRDVALVSSLPPEGERAHLPAADRNRFFERLGGGALPVVTHTIHEPGQTRQTGRSLDVAIVGPGFFRVRRLDGRIAYTRAGNFCLSPDRRLVTVDGRSEVLDDGNAPIQLDDAEIHIGRDGTLTKNERFLGRLGLVRFRDPSKLEKVGDNLFLAGAWAEDADEVQGSGAEVLQGHLELSGSNAVESMVEMIEVVRAYEANMGFVRIQDQTLARAVTDLGRLA